MQVVYESLTQKNCFNCLGPVFTRVMTVKKVRGSYASHSERGEGSGGRGDFRISKAPLGILYYNIYYYYNSLTLH